MNYNKVILAGNLTRDPELRYTPKGTAVANIGLAINRRWKDAEGETKEETCFVDAVLWDAKAEKFCEFMSKGAPVFIEGRLQYQTWEDKNSGDKRSKLIVFVESWTFTERKGEDGDGESRPRKGSAPVKRQAPSKGGTHVAPRAKAKEQDETALPFEDEDIPF